MLADVTQGGSDRKISCKSSQAGKASGCCQKVCAPGYACMFLQQPLSRACPTQEFTDDIKNKI